MTVARTIIVTAADQALAQTLAAAIAGTPGAGMFTTALSPSGQAPATHYVSSGHIDEQFDAMLHDANALYAAAQAAGVQVTLAQCQALISHSTVQDLTSEDAFATLGRSGLHIVQEEQP